MTTRKQGSTKGPWLFRGKSDDVYTAPPEGTAYSYGEYIFGFDAIGVPKDADLALILAAPELYEALAEALSAWGDYLPANGNSRAAKAFAKARAALSRATGES